MMWDALGAPETKAPIDIATFVSYVLPPLIFYFTMAVLATMPQTRSLRAAIWPVVALSALRAMLSVDTTASYYFGRKFHADLAILMIFIVTRSVYWALAKGPLVRQLYPANKTSSTLLDAFDLVTTMRGYDWNWSRGVYVPRETRPSNRNGFISCVTLSVVVHAFDCGVLYRVLRSFSPVGLGTVPGGSIFDESLPFLVRYLRSSIISIIGFFTTYSFLQMDYAICTLVGVLLLGQDPAQWPPAFDAPWRATSLAEFWGRRWHQWLRHFFLVQAGYPLSLVFGRAGLVTGAFLSSAVFHHVWLCSFDSTTEPWRMLVGFGLMAPGVLAEGTFKQLTGRRVCGVVGWLWTMTWLVVWGNVIMEGFVRAGMFRHGALMYVVPPLKTFMERLVMEFDTWLHAI